MALSTTKDLRDAGILADVDHELAETLCEMVGEASSEVRLGVAFASWAVQNGHVCADLPELRERPWTDDDDERVEVVLPALKAWIVALSKSPLVSLADAVDGGDPRPLVLDDGGRLYLHRYFIYERLLATALKSRINLVSDIDAATLRKSLDRMLPATDAMAADQRQAALLSVLHSVSVISGGPGTGKTYTVAKILILLQEQAQRANRSFYQIKLLAPTGKAAQRLGEAIQQNLKRGQPCSPEIADQVPTAASTIHRALGYQPRSPTRFRHNRQNPFSADVVVVDEASMVDVALMAKLVEAVKPDARLILLGDKDQLTSVEAGAILGDIYRPKGETGYSVELVERVKALTGDKLELSPNRKKPYLHDCMAQLGHSHRFPQGGTIDRLAKAVNAGEFAEALAVLDSGDKKVSFKRIDADADMAKLFGSLVKEKYGALGSDMPVEKKLERFGTFRFLCAHREGPMSVKAVNDFVQSHLRSEGLIEGGHAWYDGRPIIVTSNDYQVSLFNGDIGILAPLRAEDRTDDTAPDAEPPLVAYFPANDAQDPKALRHLAPGRLPPHETVYAMSVHKAQGSEAERIALLLPPKVSRVLTRELVYTAITRATDSVTIYGSDEVLEAAIHAQVGRRSGLRSALWEK